MRFETSEVDATSEVCFSVIGLAAVALVLLPGLVYRMNAEEKLLIEQFGDEYRDYARGAKRLIPGVW